MMDAVSKADAVNHQAVKHHTLPDQEVLEVAAYATSLGGCQGVEHLKAGQVPRGMARFARPEVSGQLQQIYTSRDRDCRVTVFVHNGTIYIRDRVNVANPTVDGMVVPGRRWENQWTRADPVLVREDMNTPGYDWRTDPDNKPAHQSIAENLIVGGALVKSVLKGMMFPLKMPFS